MIHSKKSLVKHIFKFSHILEELQKQFEIIPEQFERLKHQVIEDYASEISSQDAPIAYILGGQPGAGKTELERLAIDEMGGNIVSCNADNFRDYHPYSQKIREHYEIYYPELTATPAQAWNNALRDYCEENRLNFILETTFSSGNNMNKTIDEIKEKGFQVRIKLLAVHPLLSLLATFVRFENMKLKENTGRLVGKEVHDDRFYKLFSTLQLVEKAAKYNEIKVYTRNNGFDSFDNEHQLNLVAENPENLTKIFFTEVNKDWSADLQNAFIAQVNNIEEMMFERNVSPDEKKSFYEAIRSEYDLSAIKLQIESSKFLSR